MTILAWVCLALVANLPPLLLLRKHEQWGLKPLFVLVGAIQLVQVLAAPYVLPLGPHLKVPVGSAFFYPWTLGAVLFVHILAGPAESRRLLYSIFFANTCISMTLFAFAALRRSGDLYIVGQATAAGSVFTSFVLFWGTFLLFLESLLVPALFELARAATRSFRLQVFAPLAVCLLADAILFPAGAFPPLRPLDPQFLGGLVGKMVEAALVAFLTPLIAHTETPHLTTPLRFGPTLRFLLLDLDLQRLLMENLTDPLTKLWNRRHFEQVLKYEWTRGIRSRRPLAVLMLDLDNLKALNDGFGHQAGDAGLRTLADSLRKIARRESDCPARLGGDEFALLLPNTDERQACALAQELLATLKQSKMPWPEAPPPSVSIGVAAIIPTLDSSPEILVQAADQALYAAKRHGKARWVAASALGLI